MKTTQVRFPSELLKWVDQRVDQGEFASRSEAIRTIVKIHQFLRKREMIKDLIKARYEDKKMRKIDEKVMDDWKDVSKEANKLIEK